MQAEDSDAICMRGEKSAKKRAQTIWSMTVANFEKTAGAKQGQSRRGFQDAPACVMSFTSRFPSEERTLVQRHGSAKKRTSRSLSI